ncbi:pre-rRNA-processing protein TSR2 homolog isoform X2 [Olea europaea var. sylvestris]|nr:pre-rRNA-processing protein TSR2 homolog isoform X2 [Olea europaea var. sylvestris]XP_022869731.1 pre-rRNA-processing protein TSR2 homolog isoform X2 [Olea europaea var. sylvestris]
MVTVLMARMLYPIFSGDPKFSLPPFCSKLTSTFCNTVFSLCFDFERDRGERFSYCTALMESLNGAVEPVPSCSLEKQGRFSPLQERISKLLSQWTALQMAVQNEWGGCDSLEKSEQLAYDVLSWLFQSKELLRVEDLENLLHERLLLSFNTEIEDGSIEEVAEQLMIIGEDHLHGNLVSFQLNENHQKVGNSGQQTTTNGFRQK